MVKTRWWLVGAAFLCGCALHNPAYDDTEGAVTTAGSSTSSTFEISYATSQTTTDSGADSDTGTGTGTGTGTSTTSALTTTDDPSSSSSGEGSSSSTGAQAFDPFTAQNYSEGSCNLVAGCFSPMKDTLSAQLSATECFEVAVEPPMALDTLNIAVSPPKGSAPMTLGIYSPDDLEGPPIEERMFAPYGGAGGIQSFALESPIILQSSEFCVRVTTGSDSTALPIGFDRNTKDTPASYIEQTAPNCNFSLKPLHQAFMLNQATWCLSVDLSQP